MKIIFRLDFLPSPLPRVLRHLRSADNNFLASHRTKVFASLSVPLSFDQGFVSLPTFSPSSFVPAFVLFQTSFYLCLSLSTLLFKILALRASRLVFFLILIVEIISNFSPSHAKLSNHSRKLLFLFRPLFNRSLLFLETLSCLEIFLQVFHSILSSLSSLSFRSL